VRTHLLIGLVLSALCWLAFAADGADFYVAPNGNDANPGTDAAPFATVAKARDAVRQMVKAGLDHDISVQIRGGVFPQTETLVFGPDDSGTQQHSITYAAAPGDRVVLSGGRAITGWKRGRGHIWTVELPEVKAGKWYFRQLFVDGHRAVRARTPNVGQCWRLKPNDNTSDANDATITMGVDHPLRAWKNVADVEIIWWNNNDSVRKRLGSVRTSDNTFTLPPPHAWPHGMANEYNVIFPRNHWTCYTCYFENALEMLDQPGEWYLDRRTGVLSYWPRKGEDLNRAEVMAPVVVDTLLALQGRAERPVRNLHFRGVRVAYVDRPLPRYGSAGQCGCLELYEDKNPKGPKKFQAIDAAVSMKHARGCRFIDGAVKHAGGIGLTMLNGCTNNVVEGNDIGDLGGSGIVAGWIRNRDTAQWADPVGKDDHQGHRIANNHVHDCGADYFGSIGIMLLPMRDSVIAHNLVHDTAYSGIAIIGNEVPGSPQGGNNIVEYNHIHHVLKVTQDGAAIYTTFPQADRGALIRGNLIHDTGHRGQPEGQHCGGLYADGISGRCGPCANYRFVGNVVYRSDAPLMVPEREYGTLAWIDNLTYRGVAGLYSDAGNVPPAALLEALRSRAGLEPAYRRTLLGVEQTPCEVYRLLEESQAMNTWSAEQFHWPSRNAGAVLVFRRLDNKDASKTVRLCKLDPDARYEVTGAVRYTATGKTLMDRGVTIELDSKPAFIGPAAPNVLKAAPAHAIVNYRRL
jgi:hypothetical protein